MARGDYLGPKSAAHLIPKQWKKNKLGHFLVVVQLIHRLTQADISCATTPRLFYFPRLVPFAEQATLATKARESTRLDQLAGPIWCNRISSSVLEAWTSVYFELKVREAK